MSVDYLTVKRAFWQTGEDEFGNTLYGLEYMDGRHDANRHAKGVEAAKEAAIELGEKYGVEASERVFNRPLSRRKGGRAEARSRLTGYLHRAAVVSGDIVETPVVNPDLPVLDFAVNKVAIPTLGGIIIDQETVDVSRFPAAVQLPVTQAASKCANGGEWVVVEHGGRGVVMTVDEAYYRGLREAPDWMPDLSGIPSVPVAGDFTAAGIH